MAEKIENNNSYSMGIITQSGDTWLTLKFDATVFLEKLNGEEVLGIFEEEAENIRTRLKKFYGTAT